MKTTTTPTAQLFNAYQAMFQHFNERLFGGRLPDVVLNFSRRAKSHGFFAPERWNHAEDAKRSAHEISLNPESTKRPLEEVASTLVHEMVHLEQQEFGKPGRGAYHNREWAEWMHRVGLTPVSHDKPGTETGQKVSHEVEKGGAFAVAFAALPEAAMLPWQCHAEPGNGKAPTRNKSKYACPDCGANVWGKPGLGVICGECNQIFEELGA